MYVSELTLHNFRSYESVSLSLSAGRTSFIGSNGQGKTNLVEAIDFVSNLNSHRVASDAPLIRSGADFAQVKLKVVKDKREASLEVDIMSQGSNKARVNGVGLTRTRDLIGILKTVLFSPEDMDIVKGDPARRRSFIDALMVLETPRLSGVKADYEKVIKQRNALLKSAKHARNSALSTLDIWDEQLCSLGAELIRARLALLDRLTGYLANSYANVAAFSAEPRQQVGASYASSIDTEDVDRIEESILQLVSQRRDEEIIRGISLVGPHRDDVLLNLGSLPAKGYSSHGEIWSLALALRLASFELLRSEGDDPVLILDDVFAELDRDRRKQLAELVSDVEQVITTTAVGADVPEGFASTTFLVHNSVVTHE